MIILLKLGGFGVEWLVFNGIWVLVFVILYCDIFVIILVLYF